MKFFHKDCKTLLKYSVDFDSLLLCSNCGYHVYKDKQKNKELQHQYKNHVLDYYTEEELHTEGFNKILENLLGEKDETIIDARKN